MGGDESRNVNDFPIPVEIKNWADPIKPPFVRRSTFKTHVLDPAVEPTFVQICDYEPKRYRMAINVIDVSVTLTLDVPVNSPDTTTASLAPQGLYLPVNENKAPYEFFGPDAMWLNALTAVTRVTVVKEYC